MKQILRNLAWLLPSLISQSVVAQTQQNIESELILLNVRTGKETVILREKRHFEAPNWSRDGKFLIINSEGFLEKITTKGQNLGKINPEFVNNCNNDHGLSFDGKTLTFSRNDKEVASGANSRVYVVPLEGGTPKRVTEQLPSYWHGISPDSQWLTYCARRNDQWDVYKAPMNGGNEIQLTSSVDALDDGPEYSPDGQWIYFNSNRTGRMHLYRMKPDGSGTEQLTTDAYDNWFAHPSPNGRQIAYIAYLEDQKGQHPFGKDVKLRLMNLDTRQTRDLTSVFFGGQGTINVPSWSPDGGQIAFVRYRKL